MASCSVFNQLGQYDNSPGNRAYYLWTGKGEKEREIMHIVQNWVYL